MKEYDQCVHKAIVEQKERRYERARKLLDTLKRDAQKRRPLLLSYLISRFISNQFDNNIEALRISQAECAQQHWNVEDKCKQSVLPVIYGSKMT